MTGHDPAVEAAHRAWEHNKVPSFHVQRVTAAREALKPIRVKHYPVQYVNRQRCCVTCFDSAGKPAIWPCCVAPFIYREDEL